MSLTWICHIIKWNFIHELKSTMKCSNYYSFCSRNVLTFDYMKPYMPLQRGLHMCIFASWQSQTDTTVLLGSPICSKVSQSPNLHHWRLSSLNKCAEFTAENCEHCTANMLTCHSRKSTGATDDINDALIKCPTKSWQCRDSVVTMWRWVSLNRTRTLKLRQLPGIHSILKHVIRGKRST